MVNHIWWQLESQFAIQAGAVIERYYAEEREVWKVKERKRLHLQFHDLLYPPEWGVESPAVAMALLCHSKRHLSRDLRHRVLEVWLYRATMNCQAGDLTLGFD